MIPQNKLPYSENWTVDLQWQPINTWVVTLGYVGNHGVHEVIPLTIQSSADCYTAASPSAGGPYQQIYSYGWQVPGVTVENTQTLVDWLLDRKRGALRLLSSDTIPIRFHIRQEEFRTTTPCRWA